MRLGRLAGLAVLIAGMMTGCITAYLRRVSSDGRNITRGGSRPGETITNGSNRTGRIITASGNSTRATTAAGRMMTTGSTVLSPRCFRKKFRPRKTCSPRKTTSRREHIRHREAIRRLIMVIIHPGPIIPRAGIKAYLMRVCA